MDSLHDLIHASPAGPTLGSSEAACSSRSDLTAFEHEAVQAAQFRGLRSEEVTTVFLVGLDGPGMLERLVGKFPALRSVVAVGVDATTRARLVASPPVFSGALTARDCVLVGSPATAPLATMLVEVAADRRIVLGSSVLVVAPNGSTGLGDAVASTDDLLHRFAFGFAAAETTRTWLEQPAAYNTLHHWATALFQQREFLHALNCYLLLHRVRPLPLVAQQVAATWQELECPEQVLEWLPAVGLPVEEEKVIRDELAAAQRRQRQERAALAEANLRHIASQYPELGVSLNRTEPALLAVAWLRDLPWMLGGAQPGQSVARADYPLLLRVEAGQVHPVNLPEPPRAIFEAIRGLSNPLFSHACVGQAVAVDALLNVLRNPVAWTAPNWLQAIYVAQENLPVLRRFIEACDYRKLLVADRVELYWGPGAERRLLARFEDERARCLPGIRLGLTPFLVAGLERVEQARVDAAM
ncbi:MAG: hypothetical protein B7733_02630, partial [Myxococcales bacterium FL481]